MQTNEVQELKAAGVPEGELENVRAAIAAGISFSALLSLWMKYKDQIPLFWQVIQDIIAALKSDQKATSVDPYAK